MRAFCLLCLLVGTVGADQFPPEGCILLTQQKSVTLSWTGALRGGHFALFEDGRSLMSFPFEGNHLAVPVKPGSSYGWRVTPRRGTARAGHFSVADVWQYKADAADGYGEAGKKITIRLERIGPGMQMDLECGRDRKLYYFTGSDRRFQVSARGGRGRPAEEYPFYDSWSEVQEDGTPAGPGGWGGLIEISTRDAPWRDYLELDVSPGLGGQGSSSLPTPGATGKPGQVVTRILP